MVTLASIIPSLDPGDWCATLNLENTYSHAAVNQGQKKYLQFLVNPESLPVRCIANWPISSSQDLYKSHGSSSCIFPKFRFTPAWKTG